MSHNDRITTFVLDAQRRLFRLAERDHGLSLKAISLDSGIPYPSVRSYASGHVAMSVPVMLKLVGVIPDNLLSHLVAPVGKHIADNGGDEGDHDTLATNCIDFAQKHAQARHPKSPGGVEIVPVEDDVLRAARRDLRARA